MTENGFQDNLFLFACLERQEKVHKIADEYQMDLHNITILA